MTTPKAEKPSKARQPRDKDSTEDRRHQNPGRPSVYKPEFADQARKLCLLGATDMEIADFFGVDTRTINRWKLKHDKFCQSLKSGKEQADDRVERSLFERATGYQHNEVDIRVVNGEIIQTPTIKHYPPDTVAAIFWLKNRRKDEWRDTRQQELTGAGGGPIQTEATLNVSNLSSETLAEILKAKDAADAS
jgi:hypothetical protein